MRKLLATSALAFIVAFSLTEAHAEKWEENGTKAQQVEEALSKLPKEKAVLVKQALDQVRTKNKERREQMRDVHKEVESMFIAPSFDKKAYLEKVKQEQSLITEMRTAKVEALANIASQLNQEERKTVHQAFLQKRGFKRDMKKTADDQQHRAQQ